MLPAYAITASGTISSEAVYPLLLTRLRALISSKKRQATGTRLEIAKRHSSASRLQALQSFAAEREAEMTAEQLELASSAAGHHDFEDPTYG